MDLWRKKICLCALPPMLEIFATAELLDYRVLKEKVRLGWERRGFSACEYSSCQGFCFGWFFTCVASTSFLPRLQEQESGDAFSSWSCLGQWEFREAGSNSASQQHLHVCTSPTAIQTGQQAQSVSETEVLNFSLLVLCLLPLTLIPSGVIFQLS